MNICPVVRNSLIIILLLISFPGASQSIRECVLIDEGWKFSLGDAASPEKDFGCGTEYFNYLTKAASIHNAGPYSDKFDDSGWQDVSLPHDWVTDLPYEASARHSHGYKCVGWKYSATSVGWYRKWLEIPAEDRGKHIYLRFDGIFRDSRIWFNGFYLGGEPSGYASQIYDITEYVRHDEPNLLCVRADASLEEGWFYEGAGIYRHVWLNKTAEIAVAPDGTFVHCDFPGQDFSRAMLTIETEVGNTGLDTRSFTLSHRVIGPDGEVCAESDAQCFGEGPGCLGATLPAKSTCHLVAKQEIESPALWDCDSPNLYTVLTDVLVDGRVVDTYRTVTGLRQVRFDPDEGFILNGKPLKLKGVNMHQDHAGVGAAIPDGLQVWRLEQLKKFGCNAYRSSHNPMTPQMLDACDSLGFLVIEENRLSGINDMHIDLLERMIRRDRNHPSIILWSVGNEEWGIEWNDHGRRISASMREYCHRFDPTRMMTFASSSGPTPLTEADVAGYNYILQNPVDQHRRDYPERCAIGTEETTGCGTRGVYYDDVENGRMASLNRKSQGPDSLFNCIERGWKFYSERPWLGGLFYWTGFDYRGEPNPLVYPATGSEFGILDYCGFPKDEAWYLRSQWTDDIVLHILPHWNLKGHEGERVPVWVYTNCDEVELKVNGRSLGRKTCPKYGHLEWDAVYKEGRVEAIGWKNGVRVARERTETTGTAVSAIASMECCADITIVNVDLRDAKGRFVPDACDTVNVALNPSWQLLGWGNGDPAFRYPDHPAAETGNFQADGISLSIPGNSSAEAAIYRLPAFNGYLQLILKANKDKHEYK